MGLPKQIFKFIISGGGRHQRIGLGYKLGQIEHQWRWWGYVLLWLGIIILATGIFFWNKWVVLPAAGILVLSLLCETISYVSHKLEKKAMDKVRRGKL